MIVQLLPCAYKQLFGIDCPICGFQRSLILMLNGDLAGSFFQYMPLLPILILMGLSIIRLIKPNIISRRFHIYYSIIVLTVIFINYSIKLII
ncbi:MAG: DUF2752 domain-containing protein [Bacteroidia bacterium]|jgi:hypothetical protein